MAKASLSVELYRKGKCKYIFNIGYARKYLRPDEYIEFIKKCLYEGVSLGCVLDILQARKGK